MRGIGDLEMASTHYTHSVCVEIEAELKGCFCFSHVCVQLSKFAMHVNL